VDCKDQLRAAAGCSQWQRRCHGPQAWRCQSSWRAHASQAPHPGAIWHHTLAGQVQMPVGMTPCFLSRTTPRVTPDLEQVVKAMHDHSPGGTRPLLDGAAVATALATAPHRPGLRSYPEAIGGLMRCAQSSLHRTPEDLLSAAGAWQGRARQHHERIANSRAGQSTWLALCFCHAVAVSCTCSCHGLGRWAHLDTSSRSSMLTFCHMRHSPCVELSGRSVPTNKSIHQQCFTCRWLRSSCSAVVAPRVLC
jgi:hypothetical protein